MQNKNFNELSQFEKYKWYRENRHNIFNLLCDCIENQNTQQECLDKINILAAKDNIVFDNK